MSDEENENQSESGKGKDLQPAPSSGDQDEVFSLDDIDELLEESDPEFVADLEEVRNNEDLKSAEIDDDELEENVEEEVPPTKWQKLKDFASKKVTGGKLFLAKKFPKLKDYYLNFRSRIPEYIEFSKKKFKGVKASSLLFLQRLKTELPERKNYLIKKLKAKKTDLTQALRAMSRWHIVGLFGMMGFCISLLFLTHLTVTKGWLHPWIKELPGSMAEVADEIIELDAKEPLKKLYHRFPDEEYIVLLDKLVVNLRPSRSSHDRPMGYFHFYIKLNSQETAVEVKDRQREVMDLIGRTLEEHTYDELNSQLGINRFKKKAISHLNYILNQGRASEVLFKSVILKP